MWRGNLAPLEVLVVQIRGINIELLRFTVFLLIGYVLVNSLVGFRSRNLSTIWYVKIDKEVKTSVFV